MEQARVLRARIEESRARHASVDLGFNVVERDSAIGGGLIAGALAYRLFVVLLPASLLFVSGIGLYAGAIGKSTTKVAEESGLTGLVASEVAATASSGARWIVFVSMLPALLYAIVKLYKAIAIAHALVWQGSGRRARISAKGVGLFIVALTLHFTSVEIVGWIRRHDQLGGVAALLVYLTLTGFAWLIVSLQLPHRDVPWPSLVPGALLVGAGLLFINAFNVYVTTRLVENHADTYGALGIAAALLFGLVLVGRLIVASAVLNASLVERRARSAR